MSNTKNTIWAGLKAGAIALAFSCIGVLLLALVAKLFGLPDNVLPIVNQILKIVAVALARIPILLAFYPSNRLMASQPSLIRKTTCSQIALGF